MKTEPVSFVQAIDDSQLSPIVRKALNRPDFKIRDWKVNKLGGGAGNPVSVGLYRFEGDGEDDDGHTSWSVILKILQSPANAGWEEMGEGENQAHWNYWKRELLVYRSGFLAFLPQGIVAPVCYDSFELTGDIAGLWLEDIHDSLNGSWSLSQYQQTARHLGQLNGNYCSALPSPAYPWLSIDRNRQWISFPWRTLDWDHPVVLARYPDPKINTFRNMLLDHERFFARLDELPGTICHGDTYPTNFMSRRSSDGQNQTVALDWALMGIQPLGDDLGQFVFGAQANLVDIDKKLLVDSLFDAYVQGLLDYGCKIDEQLIRFGFAACAAFRVGLFQVYLLGEEIKKWENSPKTLIPNFAKQECFEVGMAKEAYQLLGK